MSTVYERLLQAKHDVVNRERYARQVYANLEYKDTDFARAVEALVKAHGEVIAVYQRHLLEAVGRGEGE